MKTIKYFISAVAILFLFAVILTCKKDPLDDTQLIINSDLIETSFALTFIDAKTGGPVGYSDANVVTVTPKGDFGNKIVDITGVERSTYTSPSGFMALGLEPDIVPSEGNPVIFNLVIEAGGYVTTSLPVLITEKSRRAYRVNMVKISDPPPGVSTIVDNTAIATNGVVQQSVTINTPVVSSTNTKAFLLLPEGTILKDKNGALLNGILTTTMVYYNNKDEESLACFPGGLIGLLNQNGNREWVEFYSGGFVEIEIKDASGKIVKTFEGQYPLLTIEIPPDTYNPETKTSVQPGDEIPLLSYDIEKGEWTYDSLFPISYSGEGGNFITKGELQHLSPKNWDWFVPNVCSEGGISLRVNKTTNDPGFNGIIKVIRLADNVLIRTWSVAIPYNRTVRIGLGPANVPAQLLIYDDRGALRAEAYTNDLCSGYVEINLGSAGPEGTINVYVDGYCPDKPNLLIKPTLGFWYKNKESSFWSYAWFINGKAVLANINLDDTYVFGIYYDGRWIVHESVITQNNSDLRFENIQFTPETCALFN